MASMYFNEILFFTYAARRNIIVDHTTTYCYNTSHLFLPFEYLLFVVGKYKFKIKIVANILL